jgi:hypothetical protein
MSFSDKNIFPIIFMRLSSNSSLSTIFLTEMQGKDRTAAKDVPDPVFPLKTDKHSL